MKTLAINLLATILTMTTFVSGQGLSDDYLAGKGKGTNAHAKVEQMANVTAPANDNFASATVLDLSGGSIGLSGNNISGSKEGGEPNHADNLGNASVWYKYTPTQTHVVRFATQTVNFDTLLAVYTGNAVGSLQIVGSNDDISGNGNNGNSQVDSMLVAGTTYYIAVDGYIGDSPQGTFTLTAVETAIPQNDSMTNAVDLGTAGGGGVFGGTNLNATREVTEPAPSNFGSKTVWYKWKPTYTHSVKFELTENFDSSIRVYKTTEQFPRFDQLSAVPNATSLDVFGYTNSRHRAKFLAENGKTYYIMVADNTLGISGTTEGNFQLRLYISPLRYSTDFFSPDDRASLAVFRPNGGMWYSLSHYQYSGFDYLKWGTNGDTPMPADFNGDGQSDRCVVRNQGNQKIWYIVNDLTGAETIPWGLASDKPVVGDFDLDGRADPGAIRLTANGYIWYIRQSFDRSLRTFNWGTTGDKPVAGDFDGDGATDVAVTRSTQNGLVWYILKSGYQTVNPPYTQTMILQWGIGSDMQAAEDYDGDGKTDVAIFRPSTGTFYILRSSTGQVQATPFGANGDKPQAGDYDGDGKADLAVFRPSDGNWYLWLSGSNTQTVVHWGISTDIPVTSLSSVL